jgi:hypothetical protein
MVCGAADIYLHGSHASATLFPGTHWLDPVSVLFGWLGERLDLLLVPGIEPWLHGYTACTPFIVLAESSQLSVLMDALFLHIYITFVYVVKVLG